MVSNWWERMMIGRFRDNSIGAGETPPGFPPHFSVSEATNPSKTEEAMSERLGSVVLNEANHGLWSSDAEFHAATKISELEARIVELEERDKTQILKAEQSERDVANLSSLVDSYKAENIELRQKLETDTLTGAKSDYYFREKLNELLKNPAPGEIELAIIDLDGFKTINDELGHMAGNEVLRLVCASLDAQKREGDVVARIGGDEIAIYSNSRTTDDADSQTLDLVVADRALYGQSPTGTERRENRANGLTTLFNRTVNGLLEAQRLAVNHPNLNSDIVVSGSVGTAFNQEGDTLDDLIKRADEAMYEAKRTRKLAVVEQQ